jgi:hypothetical protein
MCPASGRRQGIVSATQHCERMPPDIEVLLLRLIGGDATAPGEILDRARTNDSPTLLVAAALVTDQPTEPAGFLARAARHAATARDRQLVAIATSYLDDDPDLLDALVRDHLSDHPDNILAAWIASRRTQTDELKQREEQRDVRDTFERS